MNSINEVVQNNMCISCGACGYIASKEENLLKYSKKYSLDVPKEYIDNRHAYEVCPGKGYDIFELGKLNSDTRNEYDIDLGFVDEAWATHSNDEKILENASSGGIMTAIAKFLLERKIVDGIISTKYEYTTLGPLPVGFIATDSNELLSGQGSKYIPVNHESVLRDAKKFNGNLAYIGTPCQIAALKMMQEKDETLREKIKFTIGNFCGGIKDFRELKMQIKRHGFKPASVTQFRFRGGGQPGSMLIKDEKGKLITQKYPEYNSNTGYKKLKRCQLCVDATAELADFACGDAWLNKYRNSDMPWSVLITRNSIATAIMNTMISESIVTVENISTDEIKLSQKSNLTSKKDRQNSRIALYKKLKIKIPEINNGYHMKPVNLSLEFRVFLSHRFSETLETLNLYPVILLRDRLLFDIKRKIKKASGYDFLVGVFKSGFKHKGNK